MAKKLKITELPSPHLWENVPLDNVRYIRCRVLIVCEGERTEPNYFKSFNMMKNASNLVYEVKTDGGQINTLQVVEKAIELRDKAKSTCKAYDAVWAVFDKDDFTDSDFDNAITKAEKNGIGCAWSNEAFELWYVYHFANRITSMSRCEYQKTITQHVRAKGQKNYTYKKNISNMRELLTLSGGDEKLAIKFACRQADTFNDTKYHNPCTMVYKLVRLLRGEDKDFNKKIKKDLNKK